MNVPAGLLRGTSVLTRVSGVHSVVGVHRHEAEQPRHSKDDSAAHSVHVRSNLADFGDILKTPERVPIFDGCKLLDPIVYPSVSTERNVTIVVCVASVVVVAKSAWLCVALDA